MSVVHGQFTLERHYPVAPARVFHAFADPASKRRWFAEGDGWHVDHYALDLRTGGHETARFRFGDGPPVTNDTVVHDVVPGERIVSSYAMTVAGAPISASLLTIELFAEDGGTRLRLTEQGAYFGDAGGADGLAGREEGSRSLLASLAAELARA